MTNAPDSSPPDSTPSDSSPAGPDPTLDRPDQGTALDALRVTEFRRVFLASFASSIGRWMQNVALGVFAFKLTGSAAFTTFTIFAQLFPLLALSLLGGSLADTMDRRKLLVTTQAWQAVMALILAWQVLDDEISRGLLLVIVFLTGIGQALFAPAFTAVLPSLVGRENLSAAISLNSAQVNLSRMIGPTIGSVLVVSFGFSEVFAINALTYVLIIITMMTVPLPALTKKQGTASERILGGLRLARRVPQLRQPLLAMVTFSLLCLPFIGLMPVIAERNWGIDSKSTTYGNVYLFFGAGAFAGSLAVGTVLLRVSKPLVVRVTLAGFAVSMAVLATLRDVTSVYPTIFFVGLFYFTFPTALSTFLQEHLADEVRGRIMALWVISFGGIISITNLFSGAIADATSVSAVMMGGAVAAIALAFAVRLEPGPVVGEEAISQPSP